MSGPSTPIRICEAYPHEHRLRIKKDEAGMTLQSLFTLRFPFLSDNTWKTRILDGKVGCMRFGKDPEAKLVEGDEVWHLNPATKEPAVPDQIQILNDTQDYLVVFKPAPMPVHPGGRYHRNSLIQILAETGYPDLKSLHRLDSVTTGLLLFAKSASFATEAQHFFRNSSTEKTYRAWVHGNDMPDLWKVDKPIKRKNGFIFECSEDPDAKDAVSKFSVLQRKGDFSLIEAIPVTGRTHQLRLHLAVSGYPVVDDLVYGSPGYIGKATARDRTIQTRPIFLHSYELKIPPLDLHFRCKEPDEWKMLTQNIA